MPADFIITTEHRAVFSYGWGTLTSEDIKSHRSRLTQDTRFDADFRQIVLLSDVADMKLSSAEIKSLAQETVFAATSRRALVAASNVHFGLSRMFDVYGEAQVVGVFRSLEEAVAWVDVTMEVAAEAFEEIRRLRKLA